MVELLIFVLFISGLLGVFPLLQLAMRKLAYPADMRHRHIRYILVIMLLEIIVFSWLLSTVLADAIDWFITLRGG